MFVKQNNFANWLFVGPCAYLSRVWIIDVAITKPLDPNAVQSCLILEFLAIFGDESDRSQNIQKNFAVPGTQRLFP